LVFIKETANGREIRIARLACGPFIEPFVHKNNVTSKGRMFSKYHRHACIHSKSGIISVRQKSKSKLTNLEGLCADCRDANEAFKASENIPPLVSLGTNEKKINPSKHTHSPN